MTTKRLNANFNNPNLVLANLISYILISQYTDMETTTLKNCTRCPKINFPLCRALAKQSGKFFGDTV